MPPHRCCRRPRRRERPGYRYILAGLAGAKHREHLRSALLRRPHPARTQPSAEECEQAMTDSSNFILRPIGYVRSDLVSLDEAPMQGKEGAPDAWIELDFELAPGLLRLEADDDVIVLTWFHLAARDVLQLHPRDDVSQPLTRVFRTRSPDRPNPIGLHR